MSLERAGARLVQISAQKEEVPADNDGLLDTVRSVSPRRALILALLAINGVALGTTTVAGSELTEAAEVEEIKMTLQEIFEALKQQESLPFEVYNKIVTEQSDGKHRIFFKTSEGIYYSISCNPGDTAQVFERWSDDRMKIIVNFRLGPIDQDNVVAVIQQHMEETGLFV